MTEVGEEGGERGRTGADRLHVSWPSAAGVSLALGRSESVSRLDMRSSSAWTSPRPSLEAAWGNSPSTRLAQSNEYCSPGRKFILAKLVEAKCNDKKIAHD